MCTPWTLNVLATFQAVQVDSFLLLPGLAVANDGASVEIEVFEVLAVAELSSHVAVTDGVEAEERGQDLRVARNLGWCERQELEAALGQRRVREHASGQTELVAKDGSGGTTLRFKQSLRVEVGADGSLLGGRVVRVQRDVLILHFYRLVFLIIIEYKNVERLSYLRGFGVLDNIDGVQTVKKIEIVNKTGSDEGYSDYAYDVEGATTNNVIYPSIDPMIFELKYPTTDIKGKVVPL